MLRYRTRQFNNEMRKWRGMSPRDYSGFGVIKNEGKPGRPLGLQPDGAPDDNPGDAADARFNLVSNDNSELEMYYTPITETNPWQNEVYDLPDVRESARFACYDEDGFGPITFISTGDPVVATEHLTDPASNDVAELTEHAKIFTTC